MPQTVLELQHLVRTLRAELALLKGAGGDVALAINPKGTRRTMAALFGPKKDKPPSAASSPRSSLPSGPVGAPVSQAAKATPDKKRIDSIKQCLDDDDLAELRKPMEHPLAAAARKKHLVLNGAAGAVSSIGFSGAQVPVVAPPSLETEEEEVFGLVERVIKEVAVDSRRDNLKAEEDEALEAQLRRLQGRK